MFQSTLSSKVCKEPSVSSTIVSSIVDNVKGERCRKSSARVRGVDKYKGKGVFTVNEGGKYKVEHGTIIRTGITWKKIS